MGVVVAKVKEAETHLEESSGASISQATQAPAPWAIVVATNPSALDASSASTKASASSSTIQAD